jgi:hypothetical protein
LGIAILAPSGLRFGPPAVPDGRQCLDVRYDAQNDHRSDAKNVCRVSFRTIFVDRLYGKHRSD